MQITPRTFKAHVDGRLTSEALAEPINKDIRYYLHFQDRKWHLQREVHGHCDAQSNSARGASSWTQTGAHRRSVGINKRRDLSWKEKQRKTGSKSQAKQALVRKPSCLQPTSHSIASKPRSIQCHGDSYHCHCQTNPPLPSTRSRVL